MLLPLRRFAAVATLNRSFRLRAEPFAGTPFSGGHRPIKGLERNAIAVDRG
jgi:hypothetical protein